MQDLLKRVWDVLEEAERPEGMRRQSIMFFGEDTGSCFWFDHSDGMMSLLTTATTYDRLTRAVEDVLLGMGGNLSNDGWYCWHMPPHENPECYSNDDRLTAAVLALESERSKA